MQRNESFIKLFNARQTHDSSRIAFQRRMHANDALIHRIDMIPELQGHTGCVNCLEWNYDGNLLASGSDDFHVIVWDPFENKILQNIETAHQGNIFSVKFTMDDINILSGAADYHIKMHNIETKRQHFNCHCHGGRVKRLAVTPNEPTMFWSCAEDGIVMQYDLRDTHECSNECKNVLINLVHHLGSRAEAKSIAINPMRPELLAVGANDPYVRLYDRRMIKLTNARYRFQFPRQHGLLPGVIPDAELVEAGDDNILESRRFRRIPQDDNVHDNIPSDAVTYFTAGHIPLCEDNYTHRYRTLNVTYLAFSPDGNELLANLGGEHIYLFDILNKRKQVVLDVMEFFKPICPSTTDDGVISKNGEDFDEGPFNDLLISFYQHDDSPYAWSSPNEKRQYEVLKAEGDKHMDNDRFSAAIKAYSRLLLLFPNIASLYANRAAALFYRQWDGDCYQAVRDCYTALHLLPNYVNAHYRLCYAFWKLRWREAVYDCLKIMKEKYPTEVNTAKFQDLEKMIKRRFPMPEDKDSDGKAAASNKGSASEPGPLSDKEKMWRASAYDYEKRFVGHCNTTTDIKEANFFGSNGQYIVAGSDDASFYIWDKAGADIIRILKADESIVNCVQPHPSACILATSGIDPVIRLWLPNAEVSISCYTRSSPVKVVEQVTCRTS